MTVVSNLNFATMLTGASFASLLVNTEAQTNPLSTVSVLMLGLIFGLKHAVEADHVAAVTTIVSERKSILSSSLVGGLWGIGHTLTLFVVGLAVILLQVRIGERTALALELGVAIMLIALGANVIRKLVRGGRLHLHPHIHNDSPEPDADTHHGLRLGARPIVVGMVHGIAGSAALMLLVLSTISSQLIGLIYILIFGIGSIGGMMAMSALVGLPIHLTANRFGRANIAVRAMAGLFSLGYGLLMVYEVGFIEGLLR